MAESWSPRGEFGDSIKAKDCTKYLKADDPGYYFYFEPSPDLRKIYYQKGTAPVQPDPTKVAAADANDASHRDWGSGDKAGKVNGTIADCDVIRGFYLHEKTDSGTAKISAYAQNGVNKKISVTVN